MHEFLNLILGSLSSANKAILSDAVTYEAVSAIKMGAKPIEKSFLENNDPPYFSIRLEDFTCEIEDLFRQPVLALNSCHWNFGSIIRIEDSD